MTKERTDQLTKMLAMSPEDRKGYLARMEREHGTQYRLQLVQDYANFRREQ